MPKYQNDIDNIKILLMKQSKLRFGNKLEDSMEKLNEISDLLDQLEKKYLELRGKSNFERGMLLSTMGEGRKSLEYYLESAENFKNSKDKIGEAVGLFRHMLTKYLLGDLTADDANDQILEMHLTFNEIEKDPDHDQSRYTEADFNLLNRTFDISFERTDKQAAISWAEKVLEHERMRGSALEPDARYEIIRCKIKARLFMLDGKFKEAISIFSAYLDVTPPSFGLDDKIHSHEELSKFASDKAVEIAREYRDLGRAWIQSTLPDKETTAKTIWQKGLSVSPGNGNWRFLEDIKTDLSKLKN